MIQIVIVIKLALIWHLETELLKFEITFLSMADPPMLDLAAQKTPEILDHFWFHYISCLTGPMKE